MEIYFRLEDDIMEIFMTPPITNIDGTPLDINRIIKLEYNKQYGYFYNMDVWIDYNTIFKYTHTGFCEYCITSVNSSEESINATKRILLFHKKKQHDFIMSTLPDGISYKCLYFDNRHINMKAFYVKDGNILEIRINDKPTGIFVRCVKKYETLYNNRIFNTTYKSFCIINNDGDMVFTPSELVTDVSKVIFRYDEPIVKLALHDE
jgi:hypothetical protein